VLFRSVKDAAGHADAFRLAGKAELQAHNRCAAVGRSATIRRTGGREYIVHGYTPGPSATGAAGPIPRSSKGCSQPLSGTVSTAGDRGSVDHHKDLALQVYRHAARPATVVSGGQPRR